jgi:hypothetical protein
MKNAEEYKRKLRGWLIFSSLFGIASFLLIGRFISLGNPELASVVLATAWIIIHVHYITLKNKVEILQELKKKELQKK